MRGFKRIAALACVAAIAFMLAIPAAADTYEPIDATGSGGLSYLGGIVRTYNPFVAYVLARTGDYEYTLWIGDISYSSGAFACRGVDRYTYTYSTYGRAANVVTVTGVTDTVTVTSGNYGNIYSNLQGFDDYTGRSVPVLEITMVLLSLATLCCVLIGWRPRR